MYKRINKLLFPLKSSENLLLSYIKKFMVLFKWHVKKVGVKNWISCYKGICTSNRMVSRAINDKFDEL